MGAICHDGGESRRTGCLRLSTIPFQSGVQYVRAPLSTRQFNRAATPHTITGPALPNGAPLGPVM
jgi:hypothetical protein